MSKIKWLVAQPKAIWESAGGRLVALIEVPPLVGAVFCVALNPLKLPNLVILLIAGLAIPLLVVNFFYNHQNGASVQDAALKTTVREGVSIDDLIDANREDLIRAEAFIDHNYPLTSVDYFIRMITNTPSYLSRVDERMELDGQLGTVHTTLFFRQPSLSASIQTGQAIAQESNDQIAMPASVLIPLVSARKGLLFDRFEAADQSGHVLPTLSQWEIRGLFVVTLRALFTQELFARNKNLADESVRELTSTEPNASHQVVEKLRMIFDRMGLASKKKLTQRLCELNSTERDVLFRVAQEIMRSTPSQTAIDMALADIDKLADGRLDQACKKRIERFCRSIARDYFIVVEVPRSEHSNIVLSYRHVVTACEVGRKFARRKRAKHGLAPVIAEASMAWALLPDSYHFELQAPPGLYVYDHHLEKLESDENLKTIESRGVQQYARTYCEKGGSLAHLHIRRVGYDRDSDAGNQITSTTSPNQKSPSRRATSGDLATTSDFKSVIRFKEVPPGTLGSAVTIALFSTIVIFFYAFIHEPPLDGSPSSLNQSVLGLLLTLPAFLAAALGRGITHDNMRRTSLTAFYGLWMIALTSVTALLLFVLNIDRLERLSLPVRVLGLMHRDINVAWLILALISASIYLGLRKEKADQRDYYLDILKQSQLPVEINERTLRRDNMMSRPSSSREDFSADEGDGIKSNLDRFRLPPLPPEIQWMDGRQFFMRPETRPSNVLKRDIIAGETEQDDLTYAYVASTIARLALTRNQVQEEISKCEES